MTFQIHALPKTLFEDLFGPADAELQKRFMQQSLAKAYSDVTDGAVHLGLKSSADKPVLTGKGGSLVFANRAKLYTGNSVRKWRTTASGNAALRQKNCFTVFYRPITDPKTVSHRIY